jgi:hypothetical protein
MFVLKKHRAVPTKEELEHITALARQFFPNATFRDPQSILGHWHHHTD